MVLLLPLTLVGGAQLAACLVQSPPPAAVSAAALEVEALPVQVRPLIATSTFPRPEPIKTGVLALGINRVVLDAGHGGRNSGTLAAAGLIEKDLTIDIARRLRRLLLDAGVEVLMTREGDETVLLRERAELANDNSGDLFVSIHLNYLKGRRSRGVETYYLGPTTDPYVEEIAAQENRESGYSMSDMRVLLDRIYADLRRDESKALAESVQRALLGKLREVNPAIEDRGVKTAPFVVLVATEMPAILAEVSCLSHREEAELLKTADYRQTIAEALFAGIRSYAGNRVRIG
jgi:N-acetylmuramoyl-L-alanine amidase